MSDPLGMIPNDDGSGCAATILRMAKSRGGISSREVASAFNVSSTHAATMLDGLIDRGYLRRRPKQPRQPWVFDVAKDVT